MEKTRGEADRYAHGGSMTRLYFVEFADFQMCLVLFLLLSSPCFWLTTGWVMLAASVQPITVQPVTNESGLIENSVTHARFPLTLPCYFLFTIFYLCACRYADGDAGQCYQQSKAIFFRSQVELADIPTYVAQIF